MLNLAAIGGLRSGIGEPRGSQTHVVQRPAPVSGPLCDARDVLFQHEAFGGQAFSYEAVITGNAFWFRDKIVRLEDDTVVMTMANFNFHKSERVE